MTVINFYNKNVTVTMVEYQASSQIGIVIILTDSFVFSRNINKTFHILIKIEVLWCKGSKNKLFGIETEKKKIF